MTDTPHIPVLLDQVIELLNPQEGGIYVDATFGAGGYSSKLLSCLNNATVYGFDRDPTTQEYAATLSQNLNSNQQFILTNTLFSNIKQQLENKNINQIDGIMFDVGVSSMQMDSESRGFSFNKDAPLDMSMGTSDRTAEQLVNYGAEEEIANIIYQYGGERKSRIIAKNIISKRKSKTINTTGELAAIIYEVLGHKKHYQKIDPATKTFQAIRIWVNDELEELKQAIHSTSQMLKLGGRIVVVSFHEEEDRIVKHFFKGNDSLKVLTKKPIIPSREEIIHNNRSRSAKLRAAELIKPII